MRHVLEDATDSQIVVESLYIPTSKVVNFFAIVFVYKVYNFYWLHCLPAGGARIAFQTHCNYSCKGQWHLRVLPGATVRTYVFCTTFTTNCNFSSTPLSQIGLHNGSRLCFLWYTNWRIIYRVIYKSLRDFRLLRYSSRDGHAEREHANRGRDTPSFCPTLQVLDISTLGDAADVSRVIKFLPHTCNVCGRNLITPSHPRGSGSIPG